MSERARDTSTAAGAVADIQDVFPTILPPAFGNSDLKYKRKSNNATSKLAANTKKLLLQALGSNCSNNQHYTNWRDMNWMNKY